MLKRRNLEVDDEPLSPLQEQNRMAAANMTIEDIVNGEFSASFKVAIYHLINFLFCNCQVSTVVMKTRKLQLFMLHVKS